MARASRFLDDETLIVGGNAEFDGNVAVTGTVDGVDVSARYAETKAAVNEIRTDIQAAGAVDHVTVYDDPAAEHVGYAERLYIERPQTAFPWLGSFNAALDGAANITVDLASSDYICVEHDASPDGSPVYVDNATGALYADLSAYGAAVAGLYVLTANGRMILVTHDATPTGATRKPVYCEDGSGSVGGSGAGSLICDNASGGDIAVAVSQTRGCGIALPVISASPIA